MNFYLELILILPRLYLPFKPLANPLTGCLLRYKISENYTKPNFSFSFLSSDELKVVRSSFLLIVSFSFVVG